MKTVDRAEFEKLNVFGTGEANTAYARYFSGNSYLNPLTDPERTVFLANVTFESGCRNAWHITPCEERRRSDSYLHGGRRMVCRGGALSRTSHSRHGCNRTCGSKALERSCKRQLFFTHSS